MKKYIIASGIVASLVTVQAYALETAVATKTDVKVGTSMEAKPGVMPIRDGKPVEGKPAVKAIEAKIMTAARPVEMTSGDPVFDAEIKALQAEMEAKIKVIRDDYQARIKAKLEAKKMKTATSSRPIQAGEGRPEIMRATGTMMRATGTMMQGKPPMGQPAKKDGERKEGGNVLGAIADASASFDAQANTGGIMEMISRWFGK